ncbi:MAG: glycosyltransferase, partial [Actinomycetota bacterium]
AEAREQIPDLRAVILGEGPERHSLQALASSLGIAEAVAMPGFVTNPYPAFRAAAAFVLSSRWEGLPTVLIEALAVGAPVVSTDCPSGPQEILAGGRWGRLVPVADAAALAAAITAVVRAGRAAAAPPEAVAPYDPEVVAGQYEELLGLA